MTPPAHSITEAPAQACELVLNVHAYAPPAEMAGAVALYGIGVLALIWAVYLVVRLVSWWQGSRRDWHRGFEAGRIAVARRVIPLFPTGAA